MRILFVISSLAAGGAQRVVVDLASRLSAAGHNVAVLTYSDPGDDHFSIPAGVARIALDLLWDSKGLIDSMSSNFRRLSILRNAIKAFGPDRIVSFIDLTNILTLVAALGLGVPVVISERIHPRFHPVGLRWRLARRLTYPFCGALVVQTGGVARWARQVTWHSRIRIIPNAVPDRPRVRAERRESVVLAVGRLHLQKGFDLLIEAFAESRLPATWRLVIVGDGPEKRALQDLAEARGIGARVEFVGVVQDPEMWMARCSYLVLSSRYEGFPNVLLEAMAVGTPVVAFDCPTGPADVLAHGGGILVPYLDVDALASSIEVLALEPARRDLLAAETARVCEHFSQDRITAKWESLLGSLRSDAQQRRGTASC